VGRPLLAAGRVSARASRSTITPGFVLRKIGGLVVTLLVTSFVVFSSLYLAPGDPVSFVTKGRSPSPAEIAAIRHQLGLDEPFVVRYWNWLTAMLHGDFGRSFQLHQDVLGIITARLPVTFELVVMSALLIGIVGLGSGVVAALRHGRASERAVLVGVTVGAALPSFVASIVLLSVFSVRLGWFPTFGAGTGFFDSIYHLTLPAIALSITFIALVTRVTRSAMLDELQREHVEVAVSRGIPMLTVVRRHVFRNALGPIMTISGLVVAGLLVSTSIVDTFFGLNGIGSLLVQAVDQYDFPVVQAISMLIVAIFVIVNTAVDIAYPLIDPRITAPESAR
jgi:peptide/nickel transport system permease protein